MRAANVVLDVSERNGLRFYESAARMSYLGPRPDSAPPTGSREFRSHGETFISQGGLFLAPLFHGLLAELEAERISLDEALTSIDRAIELAREGDIRSARLPAAPHPRRHPAAARSRECRPGRRSLPGRHRGRARAGRAQLRPAGGAEARETLPIHRPPGRSPRHPRARARRLLADAGNARNRGGAGAARRARRDRRSKGHCGVAGSAG